MGAVNVTEEIKRCTEAIIRNQKEECEWNDRLLESESFEEFEGTVLKRSEAIRSYYEENEACLAIIRGYIKDSMDDKEVVDALYECARAMFLQGRFDPALIAEIGDPIEKKLREIPGDEVRAIIITMLNNTSMLEYYNRMIPDYHLQQITESFEWIISFKDRYCEFEDKRARENILLAYENLIMTYLLAGNEEYVPRMLALFNEVQELWMRPEVQAMDGEAPRACAIMEEIYYTVPMELGFMVKRSSKVLDKVLEIQCDYCDAHRDSEEWDIKLILRMLDISKREYKKVLMPQAAIDELQKLLRDLPEPLWATDLYQAQTVLILFGYIYQLMMRILKHSDIEIQVREQETVKALEIFHDMVEELPYQYQVSFVNALFSTILTETVPNLQDGAKLEELIYQLLLFRQPSTYLHSCMVEEISLLIANEIIEKIPELFATIPGFSDRETVIRDKEKLLDIIGRGARLHDLGKCCIASVIMQQSRRIMDDEFACIKRHPDLGTDFLNNNKDYEVYLDIIRGHHKTYDGKGGYPYTFDNTASPYRILIDLIAIADSTDAATDITGRNYTAGKNFKKLLGELVEMAGTRYNPEIVRVIADSPELIEKLTDLTEKERISHGYRVYSSLMKS